MTLPLAPATRPTSAPRSRRWGRRPGRAALGIVLAVVGLGATACQPSAPPAVVVTAPDAYADHAVPRGYLTLLGRRPSKAEDAYWQPKVEARPDATWFAGALVATPEFRSGLGALPVPGLVDAAYRNAFGRPPTASERTFWVESMTQRGLTRAAFAGWVVEHGFSFVLVRPQAGVACSGYARGGAPVPRCVSGGSSPRSVVVQTITGTNITVNVAWAPQVARLVAAAKAAGYDLQAFQDPRVPYPAGSWRSYEAQDWLYRDPRFSANPPGTSMHEWGLAIDFACGGPEIHEVPACWSWVRSHAPAYGVHVFSTATSPSSNEAWHFSSNGR